MRIKVYVKRLRTINKNSHLNVGKGLSRYIFSSTLVEQWKQKPWLPCSALPAQFQLWQGLFLALRLVQVLLCQVGWSWCPSCPLCSSRRSPTRSPCLGAALAITLHRWDHLRDRLVPGQGPSNLGRLV